MIEVLLSGQQPFTSAGIKRDVTIAMDDDAINAQKRKNIFLQGRDILLKLAESREPKEI